MEGGQCGSGTELEMALPTAGGELPTGLGSGRKMERRRMATRAATAPGLETSSGAWEAGYRCTELGLLESRETVGRARKGEATAQQAAEAAGVAVAPWRAAADSESPGPRTAGSINGFSSRRREKGSEDLGAPAMHHPNSGTGRQPEQPQRGAFFQHHPRIGILEGLR